MFKQIFQLSLLVVILGCGDSGAKTEPQQNAPTDTTSDTDAAAQVSRQDEDDKKDEASSVVLRPVNRAEYQSAIDQAKGKVLIVEYWATWCVECKEMLPHTLELAEKHKVQDLVVMTVSLDEKEDHDAALKFLTEKNAHVVNLRTNHENFDEDNPDVFELCDQTLPHLKIYAPGGELHASFSEADVNSQNVEQALEELFAAAKNP